MIARLFRRPVDTPVPVASPTLPHVVGVHIAQPNGEIALAIRSEDMDTLAPQFETHNRQTLNERINFIADETLTALSGEVRAHESPQAALNRFHIRARASVNGDRIALGDIPQLRERVRVKAEAEQQRQATVLRHMLRRLKINKRIVAPLSGSAFLAGLGTSGYAWNAYEQSIAHGLESTPMNSNVLLGASSVTTAATAASLIVMVKLLYWAREGEAATQCVAARVAVAERIASGLSEPLTAL